MVPYPLPPHLYQTYPHPPLLPTPSVSSRRGNKSKLDMILLSCIYSILSSSSWAPSTASQAFLFLHYKITKAKYPSLGGSWILLIVLHRTIPQTIDSMS